MLSENEKRDFLEGRARELFRVNADQRIKLMQFHILIFSISLSPLIGAANLEGSIFLLLGFFTFLFSLMFFILDIRSKDLISYSERIFRYYDNILVSNSNDLPNYQDYSGSFFVRYTFIFRTLYSVGMAFGAVEFFWGLRIIFCSQ